MNIQLQKLLVIGYVWPEPNSSAAGSRMLQLLSLFLQQGYQVTFASPAKQGEHKEDLTKLGIHEVSIELNHHSFDDFISKLAPQVVIFDRFMMEEQFGWRVAKNAPMAVRLLNTEDLHSLRDTRHNEIKQYLKTQPQEVELTQLELTNQASLFQKMTATDIAKREIASLFRCDLNLMISEYEIQLLIEQFQIPEQQLFHLPFLYPQELLPQNAKPFRQRQHFVSIGNFRHAPNWDAVLWLKQSIWPKIKAQLPDAECHIYGAYPPPKASALHNEKQGFLVKGWAEDAHQVIANARVLLAPLRFGAGIKGKLAEAMLHGTPSVTTSIGAEAMLMQPEALWPGAICDHESGLVESAIELYRNPTLWQKTSTNGLQLFSQQYVLKENNTYKNTLFKTIDWLNQHLESHRNNNFIGGMLNHHHHKSTQYMSQWIAEKNRHQALNR